MSLNKGQTAADAQQPSHDTPDTDSSVFDGRGGDLFSLNTSVAAGMSRFETGEQLTAAQKALQGILDKNGLKPNSVSLAVLDGEARHLPISGVLVACPRRLSDDSKAIATYLLLVEASADEPVNRTFNVSRGLTATVPAVAGDYIDENLLSNVEQVAHASLVGPGANHVFVGASVIPKEVELKPESPALRSILFNTIAAAESSLRILSGNSVIRGEDIANDSSTLSARLHMDNGVGVTQTGLPNRADVTVDLRAVKRAARNGSTGEQAQPQTQSVARIGGYMDIMYNEEAQAGAAGWGKKSEPNLQRYLPRYIITDVHSSFNFESLELQLLALAQTGLLIRNNVWANAFRPKNTKDLDIHDIGAVGLDLELTEKRARISTDPKNFTDRDFHDLIETVFPADKLIIAMDVEESGTLTWLHTILASAAEGDQEAHKAVMAAANAITSGHFETFYDGGPIGILESGRVPLGYYEDEKGEMRDIRDADYLAVLNILGQGDEEAIIEWCRTQVDDNWHDAARLEQQLKMVREMFGGSVVVKDYARRLNFVSNFIESLALGIERAGIYVNPDNVYQEMGARSARGIKNVGNLTMGSAAGSPFRSTMSSGGGRRTTMGNGMGSRLFR